MSLTDCSLREKAAVVFASEAAFVPELSLSAVLGVGSHLQDFCIWLSRCGPRGSHRPCSWHLGKRPLHYPESSGHRLFPCCCWVALRILQRLGIIWFSAAHMKQSTFKDIQGSPQSSLDHWCLHWWGLFQPPHLHLCCVPASDCPLPFHTASLYTHSLIYPSVDAKIFNQCLPGARPSEPKFENKVRAIHIYLPNAPPPRQPTANQEGPDRTQGAGATGHS